MHKLKLYGLIVGIMVCNLLISQALAFKVVTIYGHDFAASGLIFSFSFLFASIASEVYGYTLAGRIIWIQLVCQALFNIILNMFVLFPSPANSTTTALYLELYGNLWRVLIATSIAVTSSYFVNDFITSKLKIMMYGKYYAVRFLASTSIANLILVGVSYPINFYGLYPLEKIIDIAINTWTYKFIIAILLFPVALVLAKLVKRIEKLDYYDYGISYNPMKVFNEYVSGRNAYEK